MGSVHNMFGSLNTLVVRDARPGAAAAAAAGQRPANQAHPMTGEGPAARAAGSGAWGRCRLGWGGSWRVFLRGRVARLPAMKADLALHP